MKHPNTRTSKPAVQASDEMLKRRQAIQTRSATIVAFPKTDGAYRDVHERASILRAASAEPAAESRALDIIKKVQSGQPLTPEEKEYEIAGLEELPGTLQPTLEWQYGRKQDYYVAKRSPESLDRQIDRCIDLLLKNEVALADLPSDFGWCENNSIELVYNEKGHDRFFKRLLEDLQKAKRHIHLAMFGIKGQIGNEKDIAWQLAKVLVDRAAAGVEVNLVIDAKGCGLTLLGRLPDAPGFIEWLRQRRINIVINHPFRPQDLQRFLRLDHRKLYVIDGEIGYCGGMGIENQFFYDWFDVMIRMEGDIVNQLQIHFLSSFRWQGGQIALPDKPTKELKNELRRRYFPHVNTTAGNIKAKVLVNIPAPGRRAINDSYVNALKSTRESFYFMNPYCFTDWLIAKLQALAEKLYKKGHIWRPGMKKSNGVLAMFPREGFDFPMDPSREHEYKGLKRAGVGLLIYSGVLHGKLYVQDGRLSNIGSFNIDEASLERNWETNVLIDDKKFSQQLVKELFMQQETRAEVQVESTLEPSFIKWAKQQISDKLDFIT